MRVYEVEEALRESRELRFYLDLNSRSEERETFQKPFDIGILDVDPLHDEPLRGIGPRARKLGAHFMYMLKLAIVVLE